MINFIKKSYKVKFYIVHTIHDNWILIYLPNQVTIQTSLQQKSFTIKENSTLQIKKMKY